MEHDRRNRAGWKLGIFELGAGHECGIADSLEVFIADEALKGGAFEERSLLDDFELIGEGNIFKGGALLERGLADSFEVFVPDDALEGGAAA